MTATAKTALESITIEEPIGKFTVSERTRPATHVDAPMMGEANTMVLISSRNWSADEAGLKSRAKMRRPPTSFSDRVTTSPAR
ncbi:MAG: hypothetical protein QW057_10360, partial [Candidatus Bathyarchaeia archaeon]